MKLRKWRYHPFLIRAILLTLGVLVCAPGSSQQKKLVANEYAIKAALLVRFVSYVKWPEESFDDRENSNIVVMILGKDPVDDFFETHLKKKYSGRDLVIKRHRRYKPDLDLTRCHLLFIGKSEKRHIKEILKTVSGRNILTIGEFDDFMESGGMINFVNIKHAINFEINQRASSETGLRIRSDLLRRAHHVIRKNS